MKDSIVDKAAYERARELTNGHKLLDEALRRIEREEPHLYFGCMLEIKTTLSLLARMGTPEPALNMAEHGLRVLAARSYFAVREGTFRLWLDVSSMSDALLAKMGPGTRGPRTTTPADGSAAPPRAAPHGTPDGSTPSGPPT